MMHKNRDISKYCAVSVFNSQLTPIRNKLGNYIRKEEFAYSSYGSAINEPDTLMGHLERVASYAVRLASKEGVDLLCAELAGLFHDAGKFHSGQYHKGDKPEEEYSIEVLREIGGSNGLDPTMIEEVCNAIQQLYRDDPKPTPLSMVLFDADNLDKMGFLGIANYFIKSGLRGEGITAEMIIRLTVELTYARYASRRMLTKTGRLIAERRSSETIRFIHDFLKSLKEDGLFDAQVEHISISDMELEVVSPSACHCGAGLSKRTWIEQGVKCKEIHLEIACTACENKYKIKFCRPMFVV
ncbi:MAG TPA: HD domain-containing protein [Smithellaceae bacterium]|jgi:HD superfamily phosphodiesterase|nr:HD domain-containing protein [Smithellaceae bacterium]HPG54384.1 HD domain-containing protein [Smithellaceae bacterium]HPY35654.1 HD domain-containing protein [Smithellaceae bacterium]